MWPKHRPSQTDDNERERHAGYLEEGLADLVSTCVSHDCLFLYSPWAHVQFYFSDSNLIKDKFLKTLISEDEDGWVPIEKLATFKRVQVEYLEDGSKLGEQAEQEASWRAKAECWKEGTTS